MIQAKKPQFRWSIPGRRQLVLYGMAVGTVALAVILTGPITMLSGRPSSALFFAAVMLSAWYGGLGPGLLATALAVVATNYFFWPAAWQTPFDLVGLAQVVVFFLVTLLVSSLARARQQETTERREMAAALQASHSLLHAVIEGSADGIFVKDPEGRYLLINSAAAEHLGLTPATVVGRTDVDLAPEPLAERARASDRQVIETGQSVVVENTLALNGPARVFQTVKVPYRAPEGQVLGVIGLTRDVTEIKRSEQNQRLLAEAGKLLSASLDYETTLASVAQLAVPHLADWCTVHVLTETEEVQQVAVAHVDPSRIEMAYEVQARYPANWDSPAGAPNVLRTGRSELYPEITDDMLVAGARDAGHLEILRELRMRSVMIVPLAARGRTLGVMSFISTELGRHYDADDLALAEELGRRGAMAVDNARLYQAEQQARQAAERAAERTAGLQAVTAAFSEALTPAHVTGVVIEQLARLGASAGSVALLDPAGQTLEVVSHVGYAEPVIEAWRRFPLNAPVPLAEAARTRRPVFIEDTEMLKARFPELATQRVVTYQAQAALPLIVEGRVLGGLGLSFSQPQCFQAEDQAFLLALARQCAQALERARLYEAERLAREEKEVLLREVHHRVKNNLQAVTNLLYLQAATIPDEPIRQMFQETQDRIKSIALIHEKLYQTRDLARINFGDYISGLVGHLVSSYRIRSEEVGLKIEVEEIKLDVDTAIPLGIIINELVTNALKHAFPDGRNGEITVSLGRAGNNHVRLLVSDNGIGLPETVNVQNSPSLGLQLVSLLSTHMGGTVTLSKDNGTTFEIQFMPPP